MLFDFLYSLNFCFHLDRWPLVSQQVNLQQAEDKKMKKSTAPGL